MAARSNGERGRGARGRPSLRCVAMGDRRPQSSERLRGRDDVIRAGAKYIVSPARDRDCSVFRAPNAGLDAPAPQVVRAIRVVSGCEAPRASSGRSSRRGRTRRPRSGPRLGDVVSSGRPVRARSRQSLDVRAQQAGRPADEDPDREGCPSGTTTRIGLVPTPPAAWVARCAMASKRPREFVARSPRRLVPVPALNDSAPQPDAIASPPVRRALVAALAAWVLADLDREPAPAPACSSTTTPRSTP